MPVAAGVRAKPIAPRSFANASSGSCGSNGMGADSAGVSSRSPMSWSTNCPHTHPHCETSFSENRFWPASLKTRLLMYRGDGPATILLTPSA